MKKILIFTVAAVAACALMKGVQASASLRWALFAALLVAVVIARYAFYAAY